MNQYVIYESICNNGWTGTKKYFYDTYTDFARGNGASYDFTPQNLNAQIANGYAFIDVITHGSPNSWNMESNTDYNGTFAVTSHSVHPSIITTISCLTNAFDSIPLSLSERLMTNPNNAIVGYLGCSREGFEIQNTSEIAYSTEYNDEFYKGVVSDSGMKNFGRLVANAKYAKANVCNNENDSYRWIQFGLNPLGDPEMPVYNERPKTFDSILLLSNSNGYVVQCPVSGSRICVMSSTDNGATFYEVFTVGSSTPHIFNTSVPVSFCITKDGYVPFVTDSNNLSNQAFGGRFVSCSPNPTTGPFTVDLELSGNVQNATLSVMGINGNNEMSYTIPSNVTSYSTSISLSNMPNGIHILLLQVNGVIKDTLRIVKI